MENLTPAELKAVRGAVRGTIDLVRRYVILQPETPQMKRRQVQQRTRLGLLRTAINKLSQP